MILILDFGSQYTQLIARRVREARVYCEIHPYNLTPDKIRALNPKGIILSGGPASLYWQDAPNIGSEVLDVGCPVLGICYGMFVIAQHLGAHSAGAARREYGPATLTIDEPDRLFEGLAGRQHLGGPQRRPASRRACFSKTSMKVWPMTRRFCSGSVTPASRSESPARVRLRGHQRAPGVAAPG